MGGFYSSDKRIMSWISSWIDRGSSPHCRGVLAAQLRLIRKKHGTPLARGYRDHMLWIGTYPTRQTYPPKELLAGRKCLVDKDLRAIRPADPRCRGVLPNVSCQGGILHKRGVYLCGQQILCQSVRKTEKIVSNSLDIKIPKLLLTTKDCFGIMSI